MTAASDESFWSLVHGGIELERDDDYLRALLIEMEGAQKWMHGSSLHLNSGADEAKRHFHVLLLVDAGFLAPMTEKGSMFRITNAGHDFLAVTRQSEAWEAAKSAVQHLKGASIQMLFRAAEGYAIEKLRSLGIPLS